MRVGEQLLRDGALDQAALERALRVQRDVGERLGDVLVRLQLVTEEQIVAALGQQLRLPVAYIAESIVPRPILEILPEELLRRHQAFPLGFTRSREGERRRLMVAMSEPQDVLALDELGRAAGQPVHVLLAGRGDIARALTRHFPDPRTSADDAVVVEESETVRATSDRRSSIFPTPRKR